MENIEKSNINTEEVNDKLPQENEESSVTAESENVSQVFSDPQEKEDAEPLTDQTESIDLTPEAEIEKIEAEAIEEIATEEVSPAGEADVETPATISEQNIKVTEVATEEGIPEEIAQIELTPAIEPLEEMELVTEVSSEANEEDEPITHEDIAVAEVEDYEKLSREELVERLEKLVSEEDLNSIKTQVALIKVAFLKAGKQERQVQLDKFIADGGNRDEFVAHEDAIDEKFQEVFNIYKSKKQKFNDELEKEKVENLESKKQILEELKVLISSEETLKKTYDEFRALQDKWKQIGMVPKADANMLWQNYHFLVEKFFDKVKINNELKDLDLKKNLEAKIAICEKAEALLLETSILKSFKQLQQYHEEWKEIGPVPQDKKDEIWNRFKDATDKINERRREYYGQMQEEHENNLMAKNALIDQAEKIIATEITSTKLWQETTDQLNELQKVWRTIGPAPKARNEEVWHKFKSLIDTYFTTKKEFFNDIKEEQIHNYNLKLDLCTQAEAIKDSTDWKKITQEFIHLQEEWKKIGPVPRKYSDKVWKRFRSACDEFFSNKSNFFSNIQATEQDNLRKKEELITKVKEYVFSEEKKQNLEILNGFQREWMDIGFVPIKEKERLQNEFRKAINEQLDKLKISASEMNTAAFKTRYENIMKDSPDAMRIIGRERNTLAQRISKLQEEINLWENNIGFLAASRNASILKAEFEQKINKAKEEMKLLEVKMKLLKES
jgi:hypothetical protein